VLPALTCVRQPLPHLRLQLSRLLLRCLRLLREPRHFAAAACTLLLERSAELRALLQNVGKVCNK
jgi:hypothetical protein